MNHRVFLCLPQPAPQGAAQRTFLPLVKRRALNPALRATRDVADVLAPTMRALQRQVRVTRGLDTGTARAALRQQLRGMPLAAQAAALRERLCAARLSKARVSAFSQYTVFMASKGRAPVLPITANEAAPYLAWAVLDKSNKTHNLPAILSSLRCAAKAIGQWSLSERDEDDLSALIKELQSTVPSSARSTTPVPADVLLAAARALRASGTLEDEQTRAMTIMCPAVLARGTETSGDELGMKWSDLTGEQRGLGFLAYFSKKGKQSSDPRPRAFPHPPQQWEELCAIKCLREFKIRWEAAGGTTVPGQPIWCAIDAGRPTSRPLTVKHITARCREALVAHGAPRDSLHDHWARHTGSNLLTAYFGIDGPAADLLGDWKPQDPGGNVEARKSTRKRTYEHPSLSALLDIAFAESGGARRLRCCPALGSRRA